MNHMEDLHGLVVLHARHIVAHLHRKAKPQGLHQPPLRTILGVIADQEVGEVVEEHGQRHLYRVIHRITVKVLRNPVRPQRVALDDGMQQLEVVVILADPYVLLDQLRRDCLVRLTGQQDLQLVQDLMQTRRVITDKFVQHSRHLSVSRHRTPLQRGRDVGLHAVIGDLVRLEHNAHLLHRRRQGREPPPAVQLLQLATEHKHGRRQRLARISRDQLQVSQRLRLTHKHQLPVGHHRETSRCIDHIGRLRLRAVEDRLVEIAVGLFDHPLRKQLRDAVNEIRLLPDQQIDRAELLRSNVAAKAVKRLCSLGCHA